MSRKLELLQIVDQLNSEIENDIDNLSSIELFSFECSGDIIIINLFGGPYWTIEEEEFETMDEFKEIMCERLTGHKTQVDGMLKLWEPAGKKNNNESPENSTGKSPVQQQQPEICEWKPDGEFHKPDCLSYSIQVDKSRSDSWPFCHYCGRKLRVC